MYVLVRCRHCEAWHGYTSPASRTGCRACGRTFLTHDRRVYGRFGTPAGLQAEIARRKRLDAEDRAGRELLADHDMDAWRQRQDIHAPR